MDNIKKRIAAIESACAHALAQTTTLDDLEQVRITYLGRKAEIVELMSRLKNLSPDEKRIMGPLLNSLKQRLEQGYESRKEAIAAHAKKATPLFDVTAYKPYQPHGSLHIYTQLIDQFNTIFMNMGYTIVDGPEVETDYYNFTTLNIPLDHPARDSHDTFFLTHPDRLLRTHTSSVQAHAMEKQRPPLAIFAPGRVYRNEATDATHEFMFTQAEGLFIDKNVSMSNLMATAQEMLQQFFGNKKLTIRVRPGYFPFVEPGVEIDASCPFCSGNGCSLCKKTGWIELLGAGMVHPHVLTLSGIDPAEYTGFAFGFGIERLAMIKYSISDIRLFHSNAISFLEQF